MSLRGRELESHAGNISGLGGSGRLVATGSHKLSPRIAAGTLLRVLQGLMENVDAWSPTVCRKSGVLKQQAG